MPLDFELFELEFHDPELLILRPAQKLTLGHT